MSKIYGYLRVSTSEQDVRNQEHEILKYAQQNNLIIDDFIKVTISSRKSVKERLINDLVNICTEEDTVIVSELSRIGRSLQEILTIVNILAKKKATFIAIKEKIHIENGNGTMTSKIMVSVFGMLAELERDLISMRTKEALAAKKAQGVKLGKPKGTKQKTKLDGKENQIIEMLEKKVSKSSIAKILNVSRGSLINFIKTRLS